jgi:phage-related protein (TIGR01555 family)
MQGQVAPIRRERKRALGAWRQRDMQLPLPLDAQAERKPLKVSYQAAELARHAPAQAPQRNPFEVYAPAKGVLPEGATMAMDDAGYGALGWAQSTYTGAYAEGQTFLGYPELALLAQRPEYRIIVENLATEMTRKWIKFRAKGDGEDKAERIAKIQDRFESMGVRSAFCEAAGHDGYFGRGHLYLDTGDGDDPQELGTNLGDGRNATSKAKVSPDHPLRGVRAIEPVWTYPQQYNSTDPLRADWYSPSIWFAMGKQVHSSRLLTLVGREVPDLLKPAYSFGGLSMSQMMKPYVDNWLETRQSVSDIIQSFTVFLLKTNMAAVLSGAGGDDFFKRLDMFNATRSNRGVMAIDKEMEDFSNVSAPLGGLDHLQAQALERIACVGRTPLVKFTGISPSGLNASSDGELRCWGDLVHSQQENLFRDDITTILGFVQLSIDGHIDPDITFEFLPIYELTEAEKAQLRATEATTGKTLIEVGAVSQKEERARVAHDPETPYAGLDIDDLPDLKQEEAGGLMPGGQEPPDPAGIKEEAKDADGADPQVDLIRKLFGNGLDESQVELIRKLFGNAPDATDQAEALQDTIRRLFGNEGSDEAGSAIQKLFGSKPQANDCAIAEDYLRGGNAENPGQFSKVAGAGAAKGKKKDKTKAREVDPALISQVHEALAQSHPELAAAIAQHFGIEAKTGKGKKSPKAKKAAGPRIVGEPRKITTPDGSMEVTAQPELVELADLMHAEGDLQPRNRDTAESKVTARQRAASLDPEQLQPGRVSDAGAPIITAEGTVVSGNGRTMSIREAYNDPKFAERAEAYKAALGPDAKGMKQPVLVMRLPKDMTHKQLVEFADKSNRSRIEGMSATERAKRDATALGAETAALYQGGEFTSPANRQFLHAFTHKAMTANERAQFSKDGQLTKEGVDRMSAAVLASAYDDVDALSLMLESTDDNVKAITNAMRDTAGKFAQLKAGVASGNVLPGMDVTPQISDAAKLISSLRKRGVSPANHFDQIDAFDQPDPMVEALVRSFYNEGLTRAVSQQKITAILGAYADEAAKHQPGGFFPDETKPSEVLAHANRKAKGQESAGEADLFSSPTSHEPSHEQSGEGNGRQGASGAGGEAGASGGKPEVAAPAKKTRAKAAQKPKSEVPAKKAPKAKAAPKAAEPKAAKVAKPKKADLLSQLKGLGKSPSARTTVAKLKEMLADLGKPDVAR